LLTVAFSHLFAVKSAITWFNIRWVSGCLPMINELASHHEPIECFFNLTHTNVQSWRVI